MLQGVKTEGSRQGLFVSAIVAIGMLLLTPPAVLAGHYSILEVSLGLLTAAALVARNTAKASPPLAVPTAVAALLLLITASTLWSSASWYTLRDAISYIALAVTAWLLVKHGGLHPIILGVLAAGLLAIVATGVLWLFDPAAVFYSHTTALQGIYQNRNEFGAVMLQCLPAAMALRIPVRGGGALRAALVVVFLAAIYSSQSKTNMIAAVLVVIACGIFVLIRRSRRYGIALAALALVGIATAVVNSSWVLQVLGKDDTLNGRSEIWAALVNLIPRSPIIGFGFFREWPGGSTQSIAVAKASGITVIHAHNEILSWLSAVGVVGLLVVIAIYGLVYWGGWRLYRRGQVEGAIWLLLAMVMLNARGLAETSETSPQGWFIFMLAGLACARYLPAISEKLISKWVLLPLDWLARRPREENELRTEVS